MLHRIAVSSLAALALCASAALAADPAPAAPSAAPAPRWHMSKEDMAQHHAEMCKGLYARAVGKMSYLETRLSLTAMQKPLFERWKNVRLDAAKAHAAKCETFQFPGRDAPLMEKVKLEQTMLETRLANLKAETPALEALVASLDKNQQEILERAARHAMHERFGFFQRMGHHGDRMRHWHDDMPMSGDGAPQD